MQMYIFNKIFVKHFHILFPTSDLYNPQIGKPRPCTSMDDIFWRKNNYRECHLDKWLSI